MNQPPIMWKRSILLLTITTIVATLFAGLPVHADTVEITDPLELGFLKTSYELDQELREKDSTLRKMRKEARHSLKDPKADHAQAQALLDYVDDIMALNKEGFIAPRVRDAIIKAALLSDSRPQVRNVKGLSLLEGAAIFAYSGNIYKRVNRILRSKTASMDVLAYRDFLNRALDKLPIYRGPVKRGVKLFPDWQTLYQVGPYVDQAFTSTSANLEMGGFTYSMRVEIDSRTGRDISVLSTTVQEREVLFKAGTEFLIESIEFGLQPPGQPGEIRVRMRETN